MRTLGNATRRSCTAALLIFAFAWSSGAHAQEADDGDARARLHFEAGRSHFEQGSYEHALPEFQAAYDMSQRPALLFNIGATLERLGRFTEAADSFESFLTSQDETYGGRSDLESRIANLRRRATEAEAEPQDPPSSAGSSDGLLFAGIGLVAGAGVGAVLAGVFGGMALAEEDAARTGCFNAGTCTPSDVGAIDDLALGSDIAWISAAVLAAGGAALILVAVLSGDEDSSDAAYVVPVAGPDFAGIAAGGTF